MIGKWDFFSFSREDVPSGSYEAAVFLNNALRHLLNSGRSWSDPEITLLIEAHGRVNRSEEVAEVAA